MAASVAYLFPGQGAQFVGMGKDLYEEYASARQVFEEADQALGFSLSGLCFSGPEEDLRRTLNTQPAILATSYACLRVAQELGLLSQDEPPGFMAGHSLGEYTALAAAGVLSFGEAIRLVRERARLMDEAGTARPGSMAAVLGMDEQALEAVCQETGVEMANINSPGQIVISGAKDALAKAMELASARGARRVLPLEVSAAFHSRLMEPANEGIAKAVAGVTFQKAQVPIIANSTAQPVVTSQEVKEELLRQLCSPVRWQSSVEYMLEHGVAQFIEIGPGKVLTGLAKRINGDVKTVNLSDVPSLRELQSSSA
ncbi:MAG TPA: ACP S-malonyltransferase [Dehalococcoidia bacterium]|nr:ACP S-malonyltransferase [Dehalococcoidia bacterium]